MTETITISVRLPPAEGAWLALRKKENRSSVNVEIVNAIRRAMAADPLTIAIHECTVPGDLFYTVSLGRHGDDFHEGHDRAGAFAVACAKAKELGLPRAAIRFFVEDFTMGARNV
ncbi:hypothetical protein AVM02_10625 [Brucella anthropi]|uniref:hypothetical protein n=1 Tax=Brucella anthropi TaxID=529 RepID=UPI0039869FB2